MSLFSADFKESATPMISNFCQNCEKSLDINGHQAKSTIPLLPNLTAENRVDQFLPIPVEAVQVLAIFCHSVMMIVPNHRESLDLTIQRMTEWFTAATYWEAKGTYTSATKGVEQETNFLVLSWTDADSLDQYWPAVLEHALDLQQLLDQECIAVLRDGIPILLRRQA